MSTKTKVTKTKKRKYFSAMLHHYYHASIYILTILFSQIYYFCKLNVQVSMSHILQKNSTHNILLGDCLPVVNFQNVIYGA